MKKLIYSSLIALAGIFAMSCSQEHIEAIMDPSQIKPQEMGGITGCELTEDSANELITIDFTAADFGMDAASVYALFIADNEAMTDAAKLAATIADGKVSFTKKALNTAILNMGAKAGEEFTVFFQLISYLSNDKGSGIETTAVKSAVKSATFKAFESILLDKDKFAVAYLPGGYQAKGDGGAGWVFTDEQYLYDYDKSGVYTGLVDFYEVGAAGLDYGFKLTLEPTWDNGDFGFEKGAEVVSEPDMIDLKAKPSDPDNDNILSFDSHRFYMFKFNPTAKTLQKMYAFDNVGIVGAFNEWNAGDANCKMQYNKYYHRFYIDWNFDGATELKFTCDDSWDQNWGVDCVPGGANIPVEAGSYRIYLDLNKKTYEFSTSMYGQQEPGGQDKPEPEPVTYQGWGIIGSFNEWAADAEMTEKDGIWTGYVSLDADAEWKIRKDADWAENYGGVFEDFGKAFNAVAGGDNIKIGQAGFFKVVYDSNVNTITVSEGNVWSLIGGFNDWADDVDMELVEGKWIASEVALTGEWKLRYNHGWDVNRGGKFAAFDEPFEAVAGGDNINCGDGKFNVVYDPENETITISNAAKSWGVIGTFNGWAGDEKMTEVMPGIWVSEALELAGGWKVRWDGGWDVNYGCGTLAQQGQFGQAVGGGDNVPLEGCFKVVLNTNNGTIGTLGWGVTGSIASAGVNWDKDIPMNLASDGRWVSVPMALTTTDEFKIRYNAGWDQNLGGACAEANAPFAAVANGDNIKVPADGTYILVYNPEAEELVVTSSFWGLIGDFNGWAADDYMMYGGEGKWYAFNRHYEGGWKIRMGAGWDVNRGGSYTWNDPFPVVNNGDNITVSDEGLPAAGYNIIYDSAAETITINQAIVL